MSTKKLQTGEMVCAGEYLGGLFQKAADELDLGEERMHGLTLKIEINLEGEPFQAGLIPQLGALLAVVISRMPEYHSSLHAGMGLPLADIQGRICGRFDVSWEDPANGGTA